MEGLDVEPGLELWPGAALGLVVRDGSLGKRAALGTHAAHLVEEFLMPGLDLGSDGGVLAGEMALVLPGLLPVHPALQGFHLAQGAEFAALESGGDGGVGGGWEAEGAVGGDMNGDRGGELRPARESRAVGAVGPIANVEFRAAVGTDRRVIYAAHVAILRHFIVL